MRYDAMVLDIDEFLNFAEFLNTLMTGPMISFTTSIFSYKATSYLVIVQSPTWFLCIFLLDCRKKSISANVLLTTIRWDWWPIFKVCTDIKLKKKDTYTRDQIRFPQGKWQYRGRRNTQNLYFDNDASRQDLSVGDRKMRYPGNRSKLNVFSTLLMGFQLPVQDEACLVWCLKISVQTFLET
ncbi:uncharacterized protein LOC114871416 [Osmia bicornis bicornis]|uniref:uncharacterized protein LOC114871416 n=1 Tax=Osmia bicornis bicornis TaxID=1437191 RepID=UPI001EAF1A10|nr:uncharacterized protein LOC114871416 [Osmia bicornis bicornis]